MNKFLKLVLGCVLAVLPVAAQTTHRYPALDTNNTFTGQQTFNNNNPWAFGNASQSNAALQALFGGLGCTAGQFYSPFTNTCLSSGGSILASNNTFTGTNNFSAEVTFSAATPFQFATTAMSNAALVNLFSGITCTSGQAYSPFSNSCINISASNLLTLNNIWTGNNTFNNPVAFQNVTSFSSTATFNSSPVLAAPLTFLNGTISNVSITNLFQGVTCTGNQLFQPATLSCVNFSSFFPLSAFVLGTDGTGTPTAAGGNVVSAVLTCLDSTNTNTYSCNTTPPYALGAGDVILLITSHSNTSTSTLSINGSAAKAIKKFGATAALNNGDIAAGEATWLYYDNVQFNVIGTVATGDAASIVGVPWSSIAGGSVIAKDGGTSLPTAAAASVIEHPLQCSDTSGSGTAQSCTTTPNDVPNFGVCYLYSTTTASTGSGLSIAVNGFSKTVKVASGSGWTSTLPVGIIQPGIPYFICAAGSNWLVTQTGVSSSGSGSGNPGQFTSVAFSATPTFTASSNTDNAWTITLTGNVTGSTLASSAAGQYLSFQICQDATGSRTFTWPTGFAAAPTIYPAASSCTTQTFFWDGTNAQPLGPASVTGSGALWYGATSSTPPTPPAGFISMWFDSTDNVPKAINSSGTITALVSPITCTNQVVTAVKDNAASICAAVTSALVDSSVVTDLGNTTTTANKMATSTGTAGGVKFVDFPEHWVVPAANCNNATAGAGLSLPATNAPTAACRAGTNNLGGELQWANNNTTTNAQFTIQLPNDWDTTTQPYINIMYGSGANTSGTVKWTVSSACTKADGSVTDDPTFNAETTTTGKTMAAANRNWSESLQFTAMTSGNNCIAGSQVIIKLTSGNGTATSTVNLYQVTVTIPRLTVVQAN